MDARNSKVTTPTRLRYYLAMVALFLVLQFAACYFLNHMMSHLGMLDDHGPVAQSPSK
jgi:hypothetical protein